ncbi:MAG: universal stress protein, partial [Hylemonella sp.]
MKILLAVDGSEYTKKMLAYLTTHSELFSSGNDYTIFTAQPALPPRARAAVGKEIVDNYYSEEAEKILAPVSKFLM